MDTPEVFGSFETGTPEIGDTKVMNGNAVIYRVSDMDGVKTWEPIKFARGTLREVKGSHLPAGTFVYVDLHNNVREPIGSPEPGWLWGTYMGRDGSGYPRVAIMDDIVTPEDDRIMALKLKLSPESPSLRCPKCHRAMEFMGFNYLNGGFICIMQYQCEHDHTAYDVHVSRQKGFIIAWDKVDLWASKTPVTTTPAPPDTPRVEGDERAERDLI